MAKPPPNIPQTGDRVRLRGREIYGRLRMVDKSTNWAAVEWIADAGPRICHLHELEKA